jgi:hypothetical protein
MTKAIRQEFARLVHEYASSVTEENKREGDSEKLATCVQYFKQQDARMQARMSSDLQVAGRQLMLKQKQQHAYATESHSVSTESVRQLLKFGKWGSSILPVVDAYLYGIPEFARLGLMIGMGFVAGAMIGRYFPPADPTFLAFQTAFVNVQKKLRDVMKQNDKPANEPEVDTDAPFEYRNAR